MPDAPDMPALDAMPAPAFVAALGDLFEHSPWVAERVAASRPFGTARALHDAMVAAVRAAAPDERLALLRAHPELAGREASDGALTTDSSTEQGRLGFDRLPPAEHAALAALNRDYQARFGFPCIVALARHATPAAVLDAMRARLHADPAAEQAAALAEVGHITAARLARRLGRAGGALSIHALDTAKGGGAPGLAFSLHRRERGGWRCLLSGCTNAQGRTDGPLLAGLDMEPGAYRIDYEVGAYHRAAHGEGGRFLEVVPIAFSVDEPGAHYHVPVQFTPWAYGTYRGG